MGRRGAGLEELEALYRTRFDVFARIAATVTGDSRAAQSRQGRSVGCWAPPRSNDCQIGRDVAVIVTYVVHK